jgi:signal transduction histidine kinase
MMADQTKTAKVFAPAVALEVGTARRQRVLPLVIIGATGLMAALFVLHDLESVTQLKRQVHEENRLRLNSSLHHVEGYFDAVFSTLLFVSLDDDITALRPDSQHYIQKLFDYQWDHHRMAELYVVERSFQGRNRPLLTFERTAYDRPVDEVHALLREWEEYQTQMEQIREFAADPELPALLSREIRLCVPDAQNDRSKGFVYSVPIRSGKELVGIVAGMIQTETIQGALRQGLAEQQALLVSANGDFLGPEGVTEGIESWFRAEFRSRDAAAFFSQAAESFRVRDSVALWAPANIVAGMPWWLVYLYPKEAHARQMFLGGSGGRWVLVGSLLIAGFSLATLVRGIAQRFEEQTRHLRERQWLEQQVQAVSEREQRRIGERLHEDLCQRLTGIKAACLALHKQLGRQHLPSSEIVVEIADEIQESLAHARRMADELQPVSLLQHGFVAALHELAANTEQCDGVKCRLELVGSIDVPDGDVATQLYRIAQEAVGNAVKHAHPTQLVIVLSASPTHVHLTVTDDGIGIAPDTIRSSNGMGLHIARYRSDLIGADFTVSAVPEGGAQVRCSWPLSHGSLSHELVRAS